jgi:hypothetical protein
VEVVDVKAEVEEAVLVVCVQQLQEQVVVEA